MPLQPNERYDAIVLSAGLYESKEKKTPYLGFKLKTEQGGIEHKMYVSPNTVDRVSKTMQECFGTTRAQLADMAFLDALSDKLAGAEVSITTKAEEDQYGNEKIVVEWMNPRGAPKTIAS